MSYKLPTEFGGLSIQYTFTYEVMEEITNLPGFIQNIVNKMRNRFVEYGYCDALLHIRFLYEFRSVQFELRQQQVRPTLSRMHPES